MVQTRSDHFAEALTYRDIPRVREMLQRGVVTVNTKIVDHACYGGFWTPLGHACLSGSLELANILIDYGADISAKDSFGYTPLHWACQNASHFPRQGDSYMEVIQLLIERGADVNEKDSYDGSTPLHHACRISRLDLVKWLINHGANVHAQDRDGATPLYRIWRDDLELTKLMIEKGAEFDYKYHYFEERTLFHWFCYLGYSALAKLLSDNGADVNVTRCKGETPLHEACKGGHIEVVKLLLSRGANVRAETIEGSTPLQMACEANRLDVVWLVLQHQPCLVLEPLNGRRTRKRKRNHL